MKDVGRPSCFEVLSIDPPERASSMSFFWALLFLVAVLLFWFFRHIRSMEQASKQPLLSTRMFQNRVANLGLVTQNIQWLVLLGLSFVVSVYL